VIAEAGTSVIPVLESKTKLSASPKSGIDKVHWLEKIIVKKGTRTSDGFGIGLNEIILNIIIIIRNYSAVVNLIVLILNRVCFLV
jgi:hypothetical protein